MSRYSVDLQRLEETTNKIDKFVKNLADTILSVHTDFAKPTEEALQGRTGDAVQTRHTSWSAEITQAYGEMDEMKAAAKTAHGNYSAAKQANRSMLGR